MKKGKLIGKIFGIALVLVMVGAMLGGLGELVNTALADDSSSISEDPFDYQGEYVIDATRLTPKEQTALPHVQKFTSEYAISPALILAITKQESNFDPNAIGDGGLAIGYMQLHWDAAYDAGYRSARGGATEDEKKTYAREDWPTDGLDSDTNMKYGCGYLKIVYNQWGSSSVYGDSLKNAISAYNLGMTQGPDRSNENTYVNPVLGYYEDYKDKYIAYAPTWGASQNVAVIDDYYGSAVGYLYPSDYPNQIFSTLSASQVSAETLPSYDTVIMYMFNPSGLTSTQKADIVSWVSNGGKLIIWDSDQVPPGSPWDYSWLSYPFTTSLPGQQGAYGKGLNILEENQLSSSDPSSPYYIDTDVLNSQTDAVGDANVLTTYSSGWQIDMMATNILGEAGPAHVYAGWGSGLIIYSALDWDYAGYNYATGVWLKKMLRQELECSYLPFAAPPVPGEVGLKVEVISEAPEGYYKDKPIEFKVTVTNPTDTTGINLDAQNVRLTVIAPQEIEIELPPGGLPVVNIAPGDSNIATFSGTMKELGNNIKVKVNAVGYTNLGPIGGSGICHVNVHELAIPDWSFAIITDLHIGYGSEIGDWDGDGKNVEIDYGAVTWNDSAPLPQEHNYGITDKLANAIETIITEKNYYNIKFVVVLGDISDTAERSEFFKARELLNRLNDHGIPYIPLMGNHDNWPYTQDIGKHHWWEPSDRMGKVGDRDQYADIAGYAKGDEFFREVFWGESNSANINLVKSLFGDSWEYMYEQAIRVKGRLGEGCQYKFTERESGGNKFYDRSEKELVSREHDFYLQNYGFVYDGIPFVCLDLAPRLGEDLDPVDGNAIPGAVKGSFATSHPETVAFARMYTDDHESETKTAVIFSHYELGLTGMWNYIRGDYDTVYDFAGHVHYNDDSWEWWEYTNDFSYQITTEDVAGIKLHPLKEHNGEVIRIVQVKADQIDYSTTLKPMKEVEIKWSFPDFAYTFASYPEPNKEIIFTAYYTTYHGFKTSFDWDFGDGGFGSGSAVTHSYAQAGDYNVTLTVTTKNLITGEETTQTVSEVVYVRTKHIIYPLPPNLAATSLLTEENLSQVPKNTYEPALITKEASEETLIGGLGVHFEEADEDIDLSSMVADVNLAEAKSVLYMPSWPEEIEEYKLLYIPSTGVGTVYVCKNATSLEEVSLENADVIINVGETEDDMTVTTTFYNGREYYLVSGVTGTGGGEIQQAANEPPVANAGPGQMVCVIPPATTAMVTLDGSGSYDADGDPLTYTWSWDGNTAHGVNPTTELPLGTTTITLVVNDGKVDSVPDTVDITVRIPATIDFDPDVLNLEAKGKYVTAYIELPPGYDISQIDIFSIRLNGTVPALTKPTKVGDHDNDGVPDLMVKFNRAAVQNTLTVGEEVKVTITGEVAGIAFEGSDTIRVIDRTYGNIFTPLMPGFAWGDLIW